MNLNSSAKILIVDDQEANLLVLEKLLKKEGYENLRTLNDSRQTLAVFQEWQPDLLLLDLMMPHMDGFAVMEALKPLIPEGDYFPILVLTADITSSARQRALSGGAMDFIAKPFDATEVILRIRNLLQTRALHKQLQEQNIVLEEKVRQRTTELHRRLQNIEALHAIDMAIGGGLDLKLTLSLALDQVISQLEVDAASVLLFNPHTQMLEYAAGRGFRGREIERSRLRVGEGHAGRAALQRRTVIVHNLPSAIHEFVRADLLRGENFMSYYGVPLIAKGQIKGVLEVFLRNNRTVDNEWLNFLETLAAQIAIAVDNASLFESLQRAIMDLTIAYDTTIEGWSRAMDLRDKETEGHTQRVTQWTIKLARAAGIPEKELAHVRRGALLHDIGKIGVPDHILLKADKLTDEEWAIMRKHPTFAYEMLSRITYLKPALDIPYCHHEKWDGTGYPRGLKGEQIPLAARLFAVVDVWDALRSDRPYRPSWSTEKTLEHIKSLSGTHFDPKAVELFLAMISENEEV